MNSSIKNSFSLGDLPSYKNPPVNEVVCGMRFHPPGKLLVPHIGLLWDKFRDEYPIIQHAHPIASATGLTPVDIKTGLPLPRIWFINKSEDQLIQFQFDQFYFNWRRKQSDYPRYNYVIKNFEKALNIILDFFAKFELGTFKPIEYELSYINHIPKGDGWNTINDLSKIFSGFVWGQTKKSFLPNPEKVAWQVEFPLKEKKGRLIVNLSQGILVKDQVPVLILKLKTTGIVQSANQETHREWFDLAHEWIVRGFTDLTTHEIQEFWGREKNG